LDPGTCEIIEGVSFLNGPSFSDLALAANVMVHEFGHYTNLAHTVVNGQIFIGDTSGPTPDWTTFGFPPFPDGVEVIETMYPFLFGGVDQLSRTPHADDIAILSTLYPEPDFFSDTGSISGTILAPNGSTKLTGVNVIARNLADPFTDAVSAISSDFTDSTSQGDPIVGTYTINGLTPGAEYAIFVDEILEGGFSTPPLAPLPGPEEFYNGSDESNSDPPDDPIAYTPVMAVAGSPVTGVDVIINKFTQGSPLPVGEDGSVQLYMPFSYEICGQSFDSVYVNANGNLTFGAPDADWAESAGEFLAGPPRIAMLWDDLSPFNLFTGAQQGLVTYYESKNSFTVVFEDVPEFENTGSNSFQVTLKKSSDHIDVDYFELTAADGLAGVSCGGAITSGFETETDLSSYAPSRINLHNQPGVYEQFSSDDNDLADSTVRYNGTTNYEDNWAEPNDDPTKARRISLPFDSIPITRYTEIEPTGGDIDVYQFYAEAGKFLVAEILSGQLDSLIALFKIEGKGRATTYTFIAADDDGGQGLLSRIQVPLAEDGEYLLAVTTFPDFDLTGAGASGGRYVLNIFNVEEFAVVLDLGDDDTAEVPLGFSFPYQGAGYTSVFVNSNGNLTFGAGDSWFIESVPDLLTGPPRIAPLWDDLSPNQGGFVYAVVGLESTTIIFDGVPEFLAGTTNTFSVTLSDDGSVSIDYGAVAAQDGLVGVTEGGGAADPGETDLSGGGPFSATGTTYELFTGGGDPCDMGGATVPFIP
jgi:hypothetical protein